MAATPIASVMVMINMTVEPLLPTYGGKNYVAITTTTEVSLGFTSRGSHNSTPFESLSGPAKAVTLALAKPWQWRRASSGDDRAGIAFRATVLPDAPSLSDSIKRPGDDVLGWLSAPLDDIASHGRRFDTPVAWHHALENALRQPGQLGRILGLAHFVTGESAGTFDAATFADLVRPPDFDARVPEFDFALSVRASPISDLERYFDLAYKNWFQSEDDLKRQKGDYEYFGYTLASGKQDVDLSDILLLARIHRYNVRTPSSDQDHPVIDSNMWVQLPQNYDFWSGRDWFSRLPMDVAEAADLPKHFATGLMNWVAKMTPPTRTIAPNQDLRLLEVFFRLVLATYGLGARWTYERPNEAAPDAANAPTESVAHTVLSTLGLRDRNFADDAHAAIDPVQKDLNGVWVSLVGADAAPDNPALAAMLLAAASLQTAQDQATKDLAVKLSIASRDIFGDVANSSWYSSSAKSILDANNNNYHDRQHMTGNLGWPDFGFTWQSFSTFFQAAASEFREPNAAAAFVFNRWLAVAKDPATVEPLATRRSGTLAALAAMRLPQRLILDGMQDFWVRKPGDKPAEPEKSDKTPASIQLVRNRLAEYIKARLVSATANASDLLGDPKDPNSLISSVQVEIDYFVHRVGGDPDKATPDTKDAKELGSDVGVDVPQPLTFQVGAITGGADAKNDRLDLKQRFAGFGVLVRNASQNASSSDWHCLTLGQLIPRSGGPPFGSVADTASPAFQSGADLVVLGHNPWRVVTQAGLDGWVVPFHGAPLTARPKLLDAFDTTDSDGLAPDDQASVDREVRDRPYDVVQITSPLVWIDKDHFGFKALDAPWKRWDKLLALAYGRKYAFAFFAQTHSGALPPGLTDGDSPTEFRLPGAIALPDPPTAGDDQRIVGLRYLRRTHQTELNGKAKLVVLSSSQSNFKPIGRRQRIVSDQAVLVSRHIEELQSILSLEKLPFTHRPTPHTTSRPGELSSRAGDEIKSGPMRWQSTGIGCRGFRTTAQFMLRSPLAYDFALLLFCPRLAKLFDGHPEETESREREALRVSPHDTEADVWVAYIALAKLYLGDTDAALSFYRRAKELNPNYPTGRFSMAAALIELGRLDEARAEVQAGLALNPGFTLRRYRDGAQSDNPVFLKGRERIIEEMRKAGVPEG